MYIRCLKILSFRASYKIRIIGSLQILSLLIYFLIYSILSHFFRMDDNWKHFEEKDRMIEDDLRKNVDDMRHQFDEKDMFLMNELHAK